MRYAMIQLLLSKPLYTSNGLVDILVTTLAFAERNIVGDVELNEDEFFVVILLLLYIYISYA